MRDWVRALLALPQLTEEGRRRRELRQQLTEEIAEDTRPMDPRVRDLLLSPAPPSVREGERVVAVFVGAECAPWSKAGGLGDVLQALPTSLAQRGHIVLTVTPRYAPYPDVPSAGVRVPLELPSEALRGFGPGGSHALLYARVQGGVVRVFVDHPVFGAHVGRGAHVVYGTGYSDGEAEMVLMYSVMCQVRPRRHCQRRLCGLCTTSKPIARRSRRCTGPPQAALAAPVVLRDKARADAGLPGEAHPGAPLPRLVYVMNDWPSAPLALRLRRHVQTGIMATRYRRILGRRGQGFSSSVLGADRGGVSLSGSSDSETEALLVRAAQSWGPMSDSDLLRLRATAGATAGAGGGLAGHRMTRNQRWAMRMCQFAERLEAATTDAKLVLCVHNMAYQGRLPAATFADLCLPEQALEDVLHMPSWVKALDKGAGAGLRGGGLARTRPTTVGTGLEELDSGVAAMVLADRVDAVAASEPATPSQGIEVRQLDGAEGRREANGGDGAGDGSGGRRDGGGGETAVLVRFGEEVEDPAWRRAKQEARGWAKEQRSVRAGCSGGLSVGAGGRGRMPSARRVLQGAAMRRADASINWMQGAVRVADLRLTVSPTYAEEIGGGGMAGAGLTEAVLESGGIAGDEQPTLCLDTA